MKKIITENLFKIISGIMLLLATFTIWPLWYFQTLRWVVAGVAVYNANCAYKSGKKSWFLAMVVVAILFNPVLPIYLSKEVWVILDSITATIMFFSIFNLKFTEDGEEITISKNIYRLLSIIIWGSFSVIAVAGFYANNYLPHGPSYPTGKEKAA